MKRKRKQNTFSLQTAYLLDIDYLREIEHSFNRITHKQWREKTVFLQTLNSLTLIIDAKLNTLNQNADKQEMKRKNIFFLKTVYYVRLIIDYYHNINHVFNKFLLEL